MRYGLPYMGSKNKIAEKIISQLPSAEHFYDLFGGGGAISHCALLSGKYKYVHYNELDPLIYKGFNMAINGEFKNENRWISKEEFHRLKDTDPYVALCFSYGNNPIKGYVYSKVIEPYRKALHYAICLNDFSLLKELNIFIDETVKGKINIINEIKKNNKMFKIKHIEHLNRLERFQNLEHFNNIIVTNLDYRDVKIEGDSVIYCDPPYINTQPYKGSSTFNHNDFYEWCLTKKNIFISEYTMPKEFKIISSIERYCTFNTNRKKVTENLYTTQDNILSYFDLW